MALSNIFREPKRELIEQGLGVVAAVVLIGCVFGVACLLMWLFTGAVIFRSADFVFSMMFALPVTFLAGCGIEAMHIAGESICDFMANHGHDPRPRNRP